MIKQIFLDMDGVLCDFVSAAVDMHFLDLKTRNLDDAALQSSGPRFWEELDWLNEGKKLYDFLVQFCGERDIDLCILTTVNFAAGKEGKMNWLKRNTGIRTMDMNFVQSSVQKKHFADADSILVDDFDRNVRDFIQAGGNAVLFRNNAQETIDSIEEIVAGVR